MSPQQFHRTINIANVIPEVYSRPYGAIIKAIWTPSPCLKCSYSFPFYYILSPGFAVQEAVIELQTTYFTHIMINSWNIGIANYDETFKVNQSKTLRIPPISLQTGQNLIKLSLLEVPLDEHAVAAKISIKRCPVEK